ncbi:hypothetical protein LOTGIDRAFT_116426 [Lottia gigantea]|uniref:F-box domain-containing protein n=1 Tax=Lottia gigantea TaxID=225164 RepID=V4C2L8_LOTGI|nr:hypothetical protein LOTGIDRAFT_116426 [Lottia gigantea]ESO95769.1 hypothetical protein LOTGIDRAFT_116426 [Lottia gigantea]
MQVNVLDLPEELVEYILGLISPYQDLKNASLVCKQWNRLVKGVTSKIIRSFNLATQTGKIKWTAIKVDAGQTISKRYSHCACYFDKSLYVCSGCTVTNTTFNDIWRFDLTTRQWVRPLAVGAYPSPKGCASMVVYKDNLVLYGGWSHPTPYPLHQTSKFFSELDMFNPETNRWTHVCCMSPTPPPMAGHSASIIGDYMVVFGGSMAPGVGSNDVYIFDFIECVWRKEVTIGAKPSPRYGQSQVTLDNNHILILGGCGGANQILSDVWLLILNEDQAKWQEIKLENTEYAAPQLWCHPACMVDKCMVVISKSAKPSTPPSPKPLPHRPVVPPRPHYYNPLLHEPAPSHPPRFQEPDDSSSDDSASEDVNLNVSNDGFVHPREVSSLGTASVRGGLPSVKPNAMSNRQKQLDTLRKYEERFRASTTKPSPKLEAQETPRETRVSPMFLHVLDIQNVISSVTATWKPYHEVVTTDTPEETVFFSLVQGRGELIMFGGIEKDISSMQRGKTIESLSVSNTVHIVSASDFKLG